jgi:hypothetical protein
LKMYCLSFISEMILGLLGCNDEWDQDAKGVCRLTN